ncbi:hypothetical protein SLEP1_g53215 [Rubroshorea leprosula]|uniref:F-box domain-containing protein n=1 Tax=Rubroshorea leprosula TaxID=152421 RepID=A0AAV5M8W8_9ROSI|nr:hypothetical protein SLEP1_g53215 [Rubroshorea leprosula]
MSASNSNLFSPSTSRKAPATPPKSNPKIKQRRTNFTSEISTTICNSPSFTSKDRGKIPVTPPNPNSNPLTLVDERLLHCRTDRNSDTAKKTQFPSDLIEEILLRLGVKSLLRFRCVSKQWFFLLSNQQFITRHLKIQTSKRTRQEFISLSLKRGLWKTVQFDVEYSFDLSDGTHVNGYIYWLINRQRRSCCGIVSFDLSTDKLREEESLSWMLSNKSNMYTGLHLSGESLCLVESPDEVTYDVWMMEENVVTHTKSWIKLFRVSSTDGNFNTPLNDPLNRDVMTPVCFTGNGKVLIYWYTRYEYALYDPSDQSVNKVAELGNPIFESWPVSPYVESLVSLG